MKHVALAALLGLALLGSAHAAEPHHQNTAQRNQGTNGAKHATANSRPRHVTPSPNNQSANYRETSSTNAQNDSGTDTIARATIAQAVVGAFTLLVLAAQGVLLFCTLRATNKAANAANITAKATKIAADATKKSFDLSEAASRQGNRARLGHERFGIVQCATGKPLAVAVTINNLGHTEAQEARIAWGCQLGGDVPEAPAYGEHDTILGVISAGTPVRAEHTFVDQIVAREDADGDDRFQFVVYLWWHIDYKDVFGTHHTTATGFRVGTVNTALSGVIERSGFNWRT